MTCIEKRGNVAKEEQPAIAICNFLSPMYANPGTKFLRKSRNKIITEIHKPNYYENQETKLLHKSRNKIITQIRKTKLLRQFPNKQATNYLQMRKPAFVTSNLATFTAHNGLSTPKHLPIVKVLSFFIISLWRAGRIQEYCKVG